MLKNAKKSIITPQNVPIRMCILCKNRFTKRELYRFVIHNHELCFNVKLGRGVYLCEICILKENNKWHKALSKACNRMMKTSQSDLKEMIFNGKN